MKELDHLKETILLNIPDHYANVKVGDLCMYAGDHPISSVSCYLKQITIYIKINNIGVKLSFCIIIGLIDRCF